MTIQSPLADLSSIPQWITVAAFRRPLLSCRGFAIWIATAADYCAAAAVYEQLSNLSDAELERRGLSRSTLARDVCQTYDATVAH